ncbi:MAG: hypothetical protein ACXW27_08410 [Allosphingosinicella sp.]
MNSLSQRIAASLIVLTALVAAAPAARMSSEETIRVEAAASRGQLLFELDQAAWVTTDDMLARFAGRRDMPIKGWVIERASSGGGYAVTYFGDGLTGPVAWYAGAVRGGKVVAGQTFPEGGRPALTPAQVRLKEAADVARAYTGYQPCTRARFNVAIVPPATASDPIEAYLLSAQIEPKVFPAGGHYRLRIDDGKVVSHRRFMNSCMNVDMRVKPKQGEPAALFLNHILDPVPTEIHVFVSMSMRKPIYVMANKRTWAVEGARIRAVQSK